MISCTTNENRKHHSFKGTDSYIHVYKLFQVYKEAFVLENIGSDLAFKHRPCKPLIDDMIVVYSAW